MSFEILYTSAPLGLRPGSSGYCTVLSSRGIPAPTVELLESLSGYRHLFPLGHPQAPMNPVNFGHYIIRVNGRREHVLSRVSDFKLDYTGRSNKLAHHVVIDEIENVSAGPAWLLRQQGWMRDDWDENVGYSELDRIPAKEARPAGPCAAWARVSGDAGWAGVLAESFLADPNRKVFLIYPPGTDVLALFDEAIGLLPEAKRWEVTFATFGAALPATVECHWNGVIAGSAEVEQSRRFVDALRIDLTVKNAMAEGGTLVKAARTGVASAQSSSLSHRSSTSKTPKSKVDRASEDDVTFAEDLSGVSMAGGRTVGARDSRLPPSLPSARARSAEQSDPGVTRYIIGAVAGGAVIAILVAIALMWPQPKPAGDLVTSNTGNASPHDVEGRVVPDESSVEAEKSVPVTPVQAAIKQSTPIPHAADHPPKVAHGDSPKTPQTKVPEAVAEVEVKVQSPPNLTETKTANVAETRTAKGPLAIATKRREKVEDGDQWITKFAFPATMNAGVKGIRFLVPVDAYGKVPEIFAGAKVSQNIEMEDGGPVVLDLQKGETSLLTLSIPTDKKSKVDLKSFDVQTESEVRMTGPKLDKVLAFVFSGCVVDGERPYLLLFRGPPLQRSSPLPMHRVGKSESVEAAVLNNKESKSEGENRGDGQQLNSEHLTNDLLKFATEFPSVLTINDLKVNIPGRGELEWKKDRSAKGEPFFTIPEDELGSELTLTFSVTSLKGDPSPRIRASVSPGRDVLEKRLNKSLDELHQEWGKLSGSVVQAEVSKRLATYKTEESLDKLIEVVSKLPDNDHRKEIERLIEEKRKLLRQIKKVDVLYEEGLWKMQIVSARIGYTLMTLGQPGDRHFQVDLVVIGDPATEVEYFGWQSTGKIKK